MGDLNMATAKAQSEIFDFHFITSDQSIAANNLKTNENGSISVRKRHKKYLKTFLGKSSRFQKKCHLRITFFKLCFVH